MCRRMQSKYVGMCRMCVSLSKGRLAEGVPSLSQGSIVGELRLLRLLLLLLCRVELGLHAGKEHGANGVRQVLVVVHEQAEAARVDAQQLGVGRGRLNGQFCTCSCGGSSSGWTGTCSTGGRQG